MEITLGHKYRWHATTEIIKVKSQKTRTYQEKKYVEHIIFSAQFVFYNKLYSILFKFWPKT